MNEDPCSGYFGDNPNNVYSQTLPDEITLAKEPPSVPLHLAVLPQNMEEVPDTRIAAWTLQPPLSVTLTHIATLPGATSNTLSVTQRFRSKASRHASRARARPRTTTPLLAPRPTPPAPPIALRSM